MPTMMWNHRRMSCTASLPVTVGRTREARAATKWCIKFLLANSEQVQRRGCGATRRRAPQPGDSSATKDAPAKRGQSALGCDMMSTIWVILLRNLAPPGEADSGVPRVFTVQGTVHG